MAINGDGWFVVAQPTGFTDNQPTFSGVTDSTRSGNFQLNANGNLVNAAGYYLMGIPVSATTGNPEGSVPQVLQFDNNFIPAQATTSISYQANLPSTPSSGMIVQEISPTIRSPARNLSEAAPLSSGCSSGRDWHSGQSDKRDHVLSLGLASGDKIIGRRRNQHDEVHVDGSDTVGDLINAINAGTAGNAAVTASLSGGNLVLTGDNVTSTIRVTGSGANDAADLGFGATHNTFPPTNLLTQGLNGKTLTVSVGGGAPQTITFGTSRRRRDARPVADRRAKPDRRDRLGEHHQRRYQLVGDRSDGHPRRGRHRLAVDLRYPECKLGAWQRNGDRQRPHHLHQSIGRWRLHHRLRHRGQSAQYSISLGASGQRFRRQHLEFVLPDQFECNRPQAAWQNVGSNFIFNSSGQLTQPTSSVLTLPNLTINGNTLSNVEINLGSNGLTQFANSSGAAQVTKIQQNGFAAGQLQSVAVDSQNRVVGTFTNGQTIPLAQITLATFNGENSLQALNGGAYAATADSGPPISARPARSTAARWNPPTSIFRRSSAT